MALSVVILISRSLKICSKIKSCLWFKPIFDKRRSFVMAIAIIIGIVIDIGIDINNCSHRMICVNVYCC